MTSDICTHAAIGTSATLTDSRDDNTYTVQKLEDGRCWMTSNLRIVGKEISSVDSNLAEGAIYNIPVSSSTWSTSEYEIEAVTYKGNTVYGAYYTWCLATAGQGRYCTNATTSNNNSEYSICPRGWRLPEQIEYEILASKDSGWDSIKGGRILGGSFFPTAGDAYGGNLTNVGVGGYYWSGTSVESVRGYRLYFNNGSIDSKSKAIRTSGYSIRCIAR